MKKCIIALTLLLTLALCAAPAFAADNGGKINLNVATVEQLGPWTASAMNWPRR